MNHPASSSLNIRQGASQSRDPAQAAQELYAAIYQPDIGLAIFYCSPDYDHAALGTALKQRFGDIKLIGCSTAGEITPHGYLSGSLTGVSMASPNFQAHTARLDGLASFQTASSQVAADQLMAELKTRGKPPSSANTFGFLLIDGLSCREEAVVSSLYQALHGISLFGGSAADGTTFNATYLYHEGEFHSDCALFTLMQTDHEFQVFKTQHFVDSEIKMVVTGANPEQRIVTEINGEPADQEYAKAVGLEVEKLTPLIFATYPVIVKIGGNFFVRSIQKVNDDGSLTFFCAIDEGIVLTVAKGIDMIENARQLFADLSEKIGPPQVVLGCDCILRNIELDHKELKQEMSDLFKTNNVIGFATYGEQFNAMHVNQTFTGVAIGARIRG